MSRIHGLQKVHQKSERQQELRANRRRLTRELRGGIAGAVPAADEFEDLLAADLPEKEFHRQLQAGEVEE